MVPACERGSGDRRQWQRALLIPGRQEQHEHLHHRGMRQRCLGGRGGEQVEVRVIATVVLADEPDAGEAVVVRRGLGRAVVFCRVVVREAVTRLGEE